MTTANETQFTLVTKLERAIVRALVQELDAAGFVPASVWDEGEYVPATTVEAVLDAVFAVDTSTIHFRLKDAKSDDWGNLGVLIVCGNGEDCISDYHCGNKAFAAALDRMQPRIEACTVTV